MSGSCARMISAFFLKAILQFQVIIFILQVMSYRVTHNVWVLPQAGHFVFSRPGNTDE